MNKSILIFGVSGFVGRYLSEEFYENGYNVIGSDFKKSETVPEYVSFFECDILDFEAVRNLIKRTKPSYIINLAAISNIAVSWKEPQKTMAVNVNGTLNILESVKELSMSIRILLVGSSEEYEFSDKPISETEKLNANNPYGISKSVAENFANIYRQRFGMQIYCVRAFNHIGVGQSSNFVIPAWCKQAAGIDHAGTIFVGNLEVSRDFTDVRDVVRAYRMIVELGKDSIYNVGSGNAVSLKEILNYIVHLCEKSVSIETDETLFRPSDNPVVCCNNQKIKNEFGWEPKHNIFETIKEIYNSYL